MRVWFKGERFQGERHMSLQHVDYWSIVYPPQVIFAKGGGNQRTIGQGAGRPTKAAKKAAKKSGKKK
jgi:hypothetical protein